MSRAKYYDFGALIFNCRSGYCTAHILRVSQQEPLNTLGGAGAGMTPTWLYNLQNGQWFISWVVIGLFKMKKRLWWLAAVMELSVPGRWMASLYGTCVGALQIAEPPYY